MNDQDLSRDEMFVGITEPANGLVRILGQEADEDEWNVCVRDNGIRSVCGGNFHN